VPDHETKDWIRGPADEIAAANGCRFDEARGRFVVEWIESYCRLYEGDFAGEPMTLRDWQLDATLRLYGWVKWSDKWNREVRRFREASVFVPKKNKKSPTLSAWGLYLLCGDGEPGQKVFLAAKDGRQAREIAGKHAVEMLLQSEALADECKVNRSTLQITHLPSRSLMVPLSSSNSRTQESKEGLNGCVLIDEVHVVDRDFVRRLSRAGISRSEPLQIEVSTAGNNPDGYGKQRFDYAMRVEQGQTRDDGLFVAIFAAPQDVSAADLDADPERYGKVANPAWGHTIDPAEYLADYQKSKGTVQGLMDFLMYRLNVWQRSGSPWLKASDWELCRRTIDPATLAGRRCTAGLDLSRTRDMTALVLVFPDEDGGHTLLPFYWLPEDRIAEIAAVVPDILAWRRDGYIRTTPGNVIDYGFIRATFRELAKVYNITLLVYDPKFAEETTQALEQGVSDANGNLIEEGTGVPRLAFGQTDQNFATPTLDFERGVGSGTLRHDGNPVLTWQVGHAKAYTRPASRIKRVFRPSNSDGDPRTVDGVIAGIMGLAGAAVDPGVPSVTVL
jgi:phage terminase large subunit-like protein